MDETLKNANILIVDDQVANIDVLEDFLTMQGYLNIKTTTDPREVVHLFTGFNPDLILLDLTMPFLSGFEVMAQLKSKIPSNAYLPILVLTADVTTEAKQRALSDGAVDFLTKPFDLIEVGLRIRNLLYTSYLQQQLQNQNQLLEMRVQERTIDLEHTNKELIVAKDKAEASDRLKTAFIQNISHEVRTPLNGILGFAELIVSPSIDPEKKRDFFSMLTFSSNRLLNTITDYMDMSLIASNNVTVNNEMVRLNDIVLQVENEFHNLCNSKNLKLNIIFDEKDKDVKFQTDIALLGKILSHLFHNAIKFTKEGSITFCLEVKKSTLEFYIKDTGAGISKESHEKVFKIFTQESTATTRGYEGSGLGLSIVNGLLKLLGGKVRLESEKGLGSTFFITLPISNDIQESIEKEKTSIVPKTESLPIILIVEDDFANYTWFEAILEDHASKIIYARNGLEAVELCHKYPEISIVLMDLKMPIMTGFEATKEIKSFRKDLPVIAITAYALSGDESKVYEAGCDDYLPKPASREKILEKIAHFGFKI